MKQIEMVSIKHGTILHGSDSARPIGHGPIVHENNRAPYRLDAARFSTGSIVHESVMQKRLGAGSIMHKTVIQERFSTGSIVHRSVLQKWFGTGSIVHELVMHKRFGTGSIVHESVMQKRFSTSSIMHSSYSYFYSYIKKKLYSLVHSCNSAQSSWCWIVLVWPFRAQSSRAQCPIGRAESEPCKIVPCLMDTIPSRYRSSGKRVTDLLASRDISFSRTSFESPHSLCSILARDTAYFESYTTDVFISPYLLPCFVEGC